MTQTHWMIRLVRAVAILFVLAACLMVFIYTPFYSKMIVKGLNYFVPVEVNQVAAKSQQNASLSEHENLEPGSNLWIARQAYLRLVEEAMSQQKFEELSLLQARYRALQQRIEDEQLKEQQEDEKMQRVCLYWPRKMRRTTPKMLLRIKRKSREPSTSLKCNCEPVV